MPVKAKVKEQLKAKHAGAFNKLTPKAQELLVDKIAAKATTVEEVENVMNGLESSPVSVADLAELVQSESDRRVQEALSKAKQENESNAGQGQGNSQSQSSSNAGNSETKGDEMPAWAKPLFDKLNKLETEKQQTSIQAKARDLFKEKNVPEDYWGIAPLPESEDKLTDFVETITGRYTSWNQTQVNESVTGGRPPAGSGGNTGKVDADILAFAKNQVETFKKN